MASNGNAHNLCLIVAPKGNGVSWKRSDLEESGLQILNLGPEAEQAVCLHFTNGITETHSNLPKISSSGDDKGRT